MQRDAKSTGHHKELQEILHQVRKDAGLTQAELAERLGQPQSFVSKYENGERRLDLVQLHEICEAVGVPLVEFVKRFEEAYRKGVSPPLAPGRRAPGL